MIVLLVSVILTACGSQDDTGVETEVLVDEPVASEDDKDISEEETKAVLLDAEAML
jgi:hypothetical protein